jgi:hypothetical protein
MFSLVLLYDPLLYNLICFFCFFFYSDCSHTFATLRKVEAFLGLPCYNYAAHANFPKDGASQVTLTQRHKGMEVSGQKHVSKETLKPPRRKPKNTREQVLRLLDLMSIVPKYFQAYIVAIIS